MTHWQNKILAYRPQSAEEEQSLSQIQTAIQSDGAAVLSRSRTAGHITCSGFVMTPELDAVLMVYHRIYRSFSCTDGHTDGYDDLLGIALREVREETGAQKAFPLTGAILSVDVLPVPPHQKYGKPVEAHMHYNITYGIIANRKEKLVATPHNSFLRHKYKNRQQKTLRVNRTIQIFITKVHEIRLPKIFCQPDTDSPMRT